MLMTFLIAEIKFFETFAFDVAGASFVFVVISIPFVISVFEIPIALQHHEPVVIKSGLRAAMPFLHVSVLEGRHAMAP